MTRDMFNIPRMNLNRRIAAYGVATFIGATLGLSLAAQSAQPACAQPAEVVRTYSTPRLPTCNAPEVIGYATSGLRSSGADVTAIVDVADGIRLTADDGHDVTAFCRAAAVLDGGERKPVEFQIGWEREPGAAIYVTGDTLK